MGVRLAYVALLLVACEPSGARLVIDLRTDLVPEREFTEARLRIFEAGAYARREAPLVERPIAADPSADYLRGARLADESGLAPGDYVIECELSSAHFGGRGIAGRAERLVLAAAFSATLVIPRVCAGVLVALDGCEAPVCASDAECASPSSPCARARCLDGACLEESVAGACGPGEWCHPDEGCTVGPVAPDAGALDAGIDDADAGPVLDAGLALDAGGADASCVGECTPGAIDSRGCGRCGTESRTCGGGCTWGLYGGCGGEGECSRGDMEGRPCGNCGTETRTCGDDCRWGGFGSCGGQGECAPSSGDSQSCGACGNGTQSRTCNSSCAWGGFGACTGQTYCTDALGGGAVCPGDRGTRDCSTGKGWQTCTCSASGSWVSCGTPCFL